MIGTETAKNLVATSFSKKTLGNYPALILALLDVKEAALRANHECNLIDAATVDTLANAITDCRHKVRDKSHFELNELFPVDVFGGGGCIGIHLNISEYLSAKTGVSPLVINLSQSTADVCHSAFRIAILKCWPRLLQAINKTAGTLKKKAQQYRDVITLGRTCLQDASPISMGDSLSATPSALQRRKNVLNERMNELLAINLGGTAIGTGDQANPKYRAEVVKHLSHACDLPLRLRENLYDSAQNSDDIAAVMANLETIVLVLMKFARDLRILSSGPKGGFQEVSLPKVHEGSSFYRDKNNPIVPETLLQCGFLVLGAGQTMRSAMLHAELQLNVFENAIAISVLDSMDYLTDCLELLERECMEGFVVNEERCRELSSFRSQFKNEG